MPMSCRSGQRRRRRGFYNLATGFNGNFASVAPGGLLLSVQSDLGVTIATGVSAWADQSGNGNSFAQAGGTQQPTLSAGLNGHQGILFDGSNDELDNTTLVWPAITAARIVYRRTSWVASSAVFGPNTNAASPAMYYPTSATARRLVAVDDAGANNGAPDGTWVRGRALFNNTAGEYLRLGATTTSGANLGSTRTGTGVRLAFSAFGGFVQFLNMEILLFQVYNAELSAPQDAALDAAIASFYGATVGL